VLFPLLFYLLTGNEVDMGRKLLTTVILVLFFICRLWGLDPDTPVDRYLVDQWQISDGIPAGEIRAIAQTPDGYLWIATNKGLVRFDGMRFTPPGFAGKGKGDPLESTVPDTLFVDGAGTLWIGSSLWIISYRCRTGQFKIYTFAGALNKDRIRYIWDDMKGNLWISFFSSYLNRFSNETFTAFNESHGLAGKKVNAVVEDRKGNLLVGTLENGVFIFRGERFYQYPVPGLDNLQLIDMIEDQKGVLWIGTKSGLLRITDTGSQMYTTRDGLSNNYITRIIEDSDRNLWVGTVKGLNRLKKKQDGGIGFEGVLKSLTITWLLEDREKSLWVGTFDSGMRRLRDGKFISYAPLEAHREEIFLSLFEDRHGVTWVGTLAGKLFRCRGSDFVETVEIPGIPGTGITAIAAGSDGNLWLGTIGKGIFRSKDNAVVRLTVDEGLADNLVTSIYKDSRGNLWFGTFDGVSRYHNGTLESFKSGDGLLGKVVHNVYEDKYRNIWIAADKGVTVLGDGKLGNRHAAYYLQGVSVTCIYEDLSVSGDQGPVFWLATYGAGLKRLKNGKITSYTTDHGMATNFIYQFLEDQRGNFWLMSDTGILRVNKEELNRFAHSGADSADKINCASFGISDGMESLEPNNEFSRHSVLKTGNGELMYITKKGVTIVNPGRIRVNKVPPPVIIEAVVFDGRSIPRHRDAEADAYTFRGITDFRFHFTAPTFLSPEKIKFNYRLEGFEREWVFLSPGKERAVRYQDLGPGTYTFRVIAANSEGVWNRTGDSFTFTLKPLFYETFLFRIGILFLLAVLLAAVFYIYKKRPFEKNEKYKGSPLTPQYAEECIKKLGHLMEVEKVYCLADVSLQALAEKLSVSPHLLSRVLNEKLNRNFWDFINSYRIEEAKRILQSPGGAQRKIVAVAFDVGFNTTVAFYNAFKKYTDMTPSRFKKKIQREN
jgi:ligand-binding sensor domain-containing protein/AraC-like DNA-binding protein